MIIDKLWKLIYKHNLQLINKRYRIQTEFKGQALSSIKTIIYNLKWSNEQANMVYLGMCKYVANW